MKRDAPRVGLVSGEDTRSRATLSGTPWHMADALERRVGPVTHLGPLPSLRHALGRLRSGVSRILRGRPVTYHHTFALAREYGARLGDRLAGGAAGELDVLVAPFASTEIACLDTDLPVVYVSDATIRRMRGYHPGFSTGSAAYWEEAEEVERRALARADVLLYPSEWAASSARDDYGIEAARVHTVPFGANFTPDSLPPAAGLTDHKPRDRCVLAFVGVDWERKGGPVALETLRLLREEGVPAELVVCGCEPPPGDRRPGVTVLGRLDKEDPREARTLSRVLLEASFLVLPTLNDAFGIVFCEASAHGTPSLAPDTGGVAGAVVDGENGRLLPPGAPAARYAEVVAELWHDPDGRSELVRSSRDRFDRLLNWTAWADRVGAEVERLLGEERSRPQSAEV